MSNNNNNLLIANQIGIENGQNNEVNIILKIIRQLKII